MNDMTPMTVATQNDIRPTQTRLLFLSAAGDYVTF